MGHGVTLKYGSKAREKRDIPEKIDVANRDELFAEYAIIHDGGNKACQAGWVVSAGGEDGMLVVSKLTLCEALLCFRNDIKLDLFNKGPYPPHS